MTIFITCFRSVPTTATQPHAGWMCWGSENLDAALAGPSNAWVEVVVAQVKTAPYVTSEDGPTDGVGYLPEEGWYSFPSKFIVQWRWVGEEDFRPGWGFKDHGTALREARHEAEQARSARRARMVHGGVDYEALLAAQGLGEID